MSTLDCVHDNNELVVRRIRSGISPYIDKGFFSSFWIFFIGLFKIQPVEFKWEVYHDWHCTFGVIPKGTIIDGATIPRFLWLFASPTGWLFEASAWHDYCYQTAREDKTYADNCFYRLALEYNTPEFLAKIAYLMVSKLGEGSYK